MSVVAPSSVFFWVLLTATTSLYAAAPDSKTTAAPSSVTDEGAPSVEQLAALGAVAFKAGQFEQSLDYYQKAEAVTQRPEERAALSMNRGACLVELGRLGEAKAVFLRAAELTPAIAQRARLNAALVAIELDLLDEAEALLVAASPVDEALLSRAQDIQARLAEKRVESRRTDLQSDIDTATKAIQHADWLTAEESLVDARRHFDVAEPRERADVLHSLATAQLALGRPSAARATLEAALALSPEDPELHYTLGRTDEALDGRADARAAFRHALDLGLKEPLAESARTTIKELDPLSPSEWSGWLSASGGYDSNPRQSGAATETTLGRRGRGGSGYGRLAIELGRTQRVHEQLSLDLRYAGDWLGMQKEAVRELSLQNHGVFVGAQWAPTDRLVLALELGPNVTYVGLNELGQFTWDFMGSVKARYRASNVRTWRLSFEARSITGATAWDFLSGTRLDAELSHSWRYRPIEVRLGLRGRQLSIGTRPTTVDATVITACSGVCDGFAYLIPLSYTGFGPIVSTRFAPTKSLYFDAFGQFDWRRYRDESFIVSIEASRKRREDLRFSLGVDLRWALDDDAHFVLVPSYAFTVSSSNVAQSSTSVDHLYDYDDRSFVQHFAELGIEASF